MTKNTATTTTPAVEVTHLLKRYRGKPDPAVDDISLTVAAGEIFGIIGPNGAGKTSTVECIAGLRDPDMGTVKVLGLDPRTDKDEIHQVLGVQLQESQFGEASIKTHLQHIYDKLGVRDRASAVGRRVRWRDVWPAGPVRRPQGCCGAGQ